MQPGWQIPRPGLFWLLIAFAALVALHSDHLPIWIQLTALAALIWRIQIFRGVWPYPGRLQKTALVLLCAAGIVFEYRSFNDLDPLAALLVVGLTLKLLEIHHHRDALILIYLSYFVAIVQCLFFQTIGAALQIAACMMLVTAALAGIHQTQATRHYAAPIKTGLVMLAQALPLMLVMFLVMPRIGSLWAVPQARQATFGVSDRMSPGDFTDLSASGKIAFRAEFEGEIPRQQELYWRGLVLSQFDGREWSSAGQGRGWGGYGGIASLRWSNRSGSADNFANDKMVERLGRPLKYSVTLEATGAHWAYALSTPVPETPGIALTRDFTLLSVKPALSKIRYDVTSWLDYRLQSKTLMPAQRKQETRLPSQSNPQTQTIARQWAEQTPQPRALIERVLDMFNKDYIYTLQAPALGEHTVDDFLWQTRTGFCEHFASSFVVFMRAAGIPARVVVGYQGGERNPTENYLIVHQYDAHAWAEVWLQGQGWVRVDPTAAVAPERIQMTVADLLANEKGFLADSPFSALRLNHISWVRKLRLRIDALDYAWAKWVLGYDSVQNSLLAGILGEVNPQRIGFLLLIAGSIAMLPLAVWFMLTARGKPRSELDRLLLLFFERLKRAGVDRRPGEGLRSVAGRACTQLPALAPQTRTIAQQFELYKYGGQDQDLAGLGRQVRAYRPARAKTP